MREGAQARLEIKLSGIGVAAADALDRAAVRLDVDDVADLHLCSAEAVLAAGRQTRASEGGTLGRLSPFPSVGHRRWSGRV